MEPLTEEQKKLFDELANLLKAEKVAEFNAYREANPDVQISLFFDDFSGKNLEGANFNDVFLMGTVFIDAELEGATFERANVYAALFQDSKGADLSKALNVDKTFENMYGTPVE